MTVLPSGNDPLPEPCGSPGQLEHELSQNAWLTVRAKPDIIFDRLPEARLPAAMSLLGIDFANLSEQAGHA